METTSLEMSNSNNRLKGIAIPAESLASISGDGSSSSSSCLSSVFVGMDGEEIGTVGMDENGNCVSFVTTRSVPNLDGLDVGAPDGLCTDIVLLHPHRPYLYAVASFGSHRPSVIITYEITTLFQQPSSLRRIGSSSTVGYRATDAKISPNGRFLAISHTCSTNNTSSSSSSSNPYSSSGGSTITIFNCDVDGALSKAPITVQDIPSIPSTMTISSVVTSYVSFFARLATFLYPRRNSNNSTIPSAHGLSFTPDGSTLIVCDAVHARILCWSMDSTTGQLLQSSSYSHNDESSSSSETATPSRTMEVLPFQVTDCPHPSWFESTQSWSNMALRLSVGIRPIQSIVHPSGDYCFVLYETSSMVTWHKFIVTTTHNDDSNHRSNNAKNNNLSNHHSTKTTRKLGPPLGSISTIFDGCLPSNTDNDDDDDGHTNSNRNMDVDFINEDTADNNQTGNHDAGMILKTRGLSLACEFQLSEDGTTLYVLNKMPNDEYGSYITTFYFKTSDDDDNGSLTPIHRTNISSGAVANSILLLKQDLLLVSSHTNKVGEVTAENGECVNNQLNIFHTNSTGGKSGRGMKFLSTNTFTKKGAKKVWSMASSSVLLQEQTAIMSNSV